MGKHLSDSFPIKNGMNKGDALSILLSNFASQHTVRNVRENQEGLE
jgi:hypothetical protein